MPTAKASQFTSSGVIMGAVVGLLIGLLVGASFSSYLGARSFRGSGARPTDLVAMIARLQSQMCTQQAGNALPGGRLPTVDPAYCDYLTKLRECFLSARTPADIGQCKLIAPALPTLPRR